MRTQKRLTVLVLWARFALVAVLATRVTRARRAGGDLAVQEYVAAELPDPLPGDCDRLVAPGPGAAAGVLRPLNLSRSSERNLTLVACVKDSDASEALLHVLPASEYHRAARSMNPVTLGPGTTAIVWSDVPAGSHVAFIEVGPAISRPCFFSIDSPLQHNAAAASGRDRSWQAGRRHEPSDEWPIFGHLRSQQRRVEALGFCGVSDWQPVSIHEVISAFLKSEWYKEEHRDWRGVEPMESVVHRPDLSSDHENAMRAMLMATPRKVRAFPPFQSAAAAEVALGFTRVSTDQHAPHVAAGHAVVSGARRRPPHGVVAPHVREGWRLRLPA